MAVQLGLCRTRSENQNVGFLMTWLICVYRVKERELELESVDVTVGIMGSYVMTVKTTIMRLRKMIHIPLV